MQFQVPQFIETEDKIFGPLTLKQFLYLTASTLICIFSYFVFAFWLWIVVVAVIEGTTALFNLVKVNGRPMRVLATAAFFYVWSPRVYAYRSSLELAVASVSPVAPIAPKNAPTQTGSLRNLLDKLTTTKEIIPNRESALPDRAKSTSQSTKDRYELIKKITGDEEVARRIDYR